MVSEVPDPEFGQALASHYLRIVGPVVEVEEENTAPALPARKTHAESHKSAHGMEMALCEVVAFLSVKAFAVENGRGHTSSSLPCGRYDR